MLKEALAPCPSRQTTSAYAVDDSHQNLIDYRLVMDDRWNWDAVSAERFVEMISSDGILGDPLVKTQHLLGATVRLEIAVVFPSLPQSLKRRSEV